MNKVTVLVTEPEYRKAEAVFTGAAELRCVPAPFDEEALAACIRGEGARYAIVGPARYSGSIYRVLPAGGVLARFGVGHDGIDKAKATAARVLCTNTPGVLENSVAEHTLLLLLAAARRLPQAFAAATNSAAWSVASGQELSSCTLAVIGCGPIGRAVARMAAFGFGMRVMGCRPVGRLEDDVAERCGFQSVHADFAEAVREADFVSLHIAAVPASARYLNAARIAQLAPRAWLINTARGSVVDENALYDALAAGRIAGAALDVFEREPYQPADPARDLRHLPNVIMTPHIASHTAQANGRMAARAIRNIVLAESATWNEMDLLNPEVLSSGPPFGAPA